MSARRGLVNSIFGLTIAAAALLNATESGAQNPEQLLWGSYLGGAGVDEIAAIAVDRGGMPIVAGKTQGAPGLQFDGFVAKFSIGGDSLLFYELIGGSADESLYNVVVDEAGQVYLAGRTNSWDFPVTPGAYAKPGSVGQGGDIFVAKWDSSVVPPIPVFSIVIGGSGLDVTFESCLEIGPDGCIYVTGQTNSGDFPTTDGAYDRTPNGGDDSFVLKLAADGSQIIYSTFLGGNALDSARGIAVDNSHQVYVKGFTDSTNFPTRHPFQEDQGGRDFFVTKLNDNGSELIYSTYLGGSGWEAGSYGSLVLTASGEVYVSGFTESWDFPIPPGSDSYDPVFNGVRDGCLVKLDSTGFLESATFLGGRYRDNGNEITLDEAGNLWWTATAGSDNFPTTPGAFNRDLGSPGSDVILACLDGNLSELKYSTYFGGPHAVETFLSLDPLSDALYVWAGVFADPAYPEFPTTPGAYDTSYNGDRDGYLAKIDPTINMSDSEGDGMPDWWELLYGFDVFSDDSAADADNDGLDNIREYVDFRNPLSPQTKYRLGPATELLDKSFYVGEGYDNSSIAGRWAYFGRAASDNKTVVFWAWNVATNQYALFLVDIGDPSSWRRLTADVTIGGPLPLCWTPDDKYILVGGQRIPVATGEIIPHSIHGYPTTSGGIASTRMALENWAVVYPPPNQANGDLVMVPILPNADTDVTRAPVQITNMQPNQQEAEWQDIRPDGSMIAFQSAVFTEPRPDDKDVYVLRDVQAILADPTLAPVSLMDPGFIIPIRTTETENFAGFPYFSEDGSLIIYSEEVSQLVRRNTDVPSVLFQCDWDVIISDTATGQDYELVEPDNQAFAIPTPGGMRLLYNRATGNEMHLLISTLEVRQQVLGIQGGGNTLNTVEIQTVSDASGTTVTIPEGTQIVFPHGAPQVIEITTPIDPASDTELPPDVNAIAVIRAFGPSGTSFNPPIEVTITYTDEEIAGLVEATLRVFEYNSMTGKYDLEVKTILKRDLDANRITFAVRHFSLYGLGNATPFSFTGFLPPIGGADATGGSVDDPVKAFKLGSTIPLKFIVADSNGPVYDGIHTLQAAKYSNSTNTTELPIDATPTDAATTGNQFRLVDGVWHFNLETKAGFSQGTWQLTATLSDGTKHRVWVVIK